MLVLITYDVNTTTSSGRGRLRKVARICENYGQRVQNSVFECLVDPTLWVLFSKKLLEVIDPNEDSLRFYFLGSNWHRKVEHFGARKSYDPEGFLVI